MKQAKFNFGYKKLQKSYILLQTLMLFIAVHPQTISIYLLQFIVNNCIELISLITLYVVAFRSQMVIMIDCTAVWRDTSQVPNCDSLLEDAEIIPYKISLL